MRLLEMRHVHELTKIPINNVDYLQIFYGLMLTKIGLLTELLTILLIEN